MNKEQKERKFYCDLGEAMHGGSCEVQCKICSLDKKKNEQFESKGVQEQQKPEERTCKDCGKSMRITEDEQQKDAAPTEEGRERPCTSNEGKINPQTTLTEEIIWGIYCDLFPFLTGKKDDILPVLNKGFAILQQRIAELEKENTEWKWKLNDAKVINEGFERKTSELEAQQKETAEKAWDAAVKWREWGIYGKTVQPPFNKTFYLSQFNTSPEKKEE